MAGVSKIVYVDPPEAAADGCTASCPGTETTYPDGGWLREYTLSASAQGNWEFSKFTWKTVHTTQSGSNDPVEHESDTNPNTEDIREQRTNITSTLWVEDTVIDVQAHFVPSAPPSTFTVTAEAKYAAGGIVTGGGTYSAGTTITLTATPNQGYHFAGWASSAGETKPNPSFPYTVTSDVTWTAYFGTDRLIYFDETGSATEPGNATVTIDFDPKEWTCVAYGQDHAVSLALTPSWASATTITAQGIIPLDKSTIAGASSFTLGLEAITSCSAGVYPTVTAVVVVQQANVRTVMKEVQITVGMLSTVTISASDGSITGIT